MKILGFVLELVLAVAAVGAAGAGLYYGWKKVVKPLLSSKSEKSGKSSSSCSGSSCSGSGKSSSSSSSSSSSGSSSSSRSGRSSSDEGKSGTAAGKRTRGGKDGMFAQYAACVESRSGQSSGDNSSVREYCYEYYPYREES